MMPAARAAKIICCLGIRSASSVGSMPVSSAKSSPPMSTAAVHAPGVLRDELARVVLLVHWHAVLQIEQDAVRAAGVRLVDVLLDVHRHIKQRAPQRKSGFHSCSPLGVPPPSHTIPAATSFAYAVLSTPISASSARLCSPSFGAGARIAPGVRERRGVTWCMGKAPMSGSG